VRALRTWRGTLAVTAHTPAGPSAPQATHRQGRPALCAAQCYPTLGIFTVSLLPVSQLKEKAAPVGGEEAAERQRVKEVLDAANTLHRTLGFFLKSQLDLALSLAVAQLHSSGQVFHDAPAMASGEGTRADPCLYGGFEG
jgi:hypothetical protein